MENFSQQPIDVEKEADHGKKERPFGGIMPGHRLRMISTIIQDFNKESLPGKKELYELQKQVVADICSAILQSPKKLNGHIEEPTGAGKTIIAIETALGMGTGVIFSAPTRVVKDQFREALKSIGAKPYKKSSVHVPVGQGRRTAADLQTGAVENRSNESLSYLPITHTLLPSSFASKLNDESDLFQLPNGQRALIVTHDFLRSNPQACASWVSSGHDGILIIDEAHMAIGEQTREGLRHFLQNPQWMVLGLSATPEYAIASVGTEEHTVAAHIGPCLNRTTIQEAVNAGLIAPFEMLELTASLPDAISMWDRKGRNGKTRDLQIMRQDYLISSVVELLKNSYLLGKKVIVACNSREIAREIQRELSTTYASFYIDGDMSTGTRRETCRAFNDSTGSVLIGAKLVGVGLDVRGVDAVIAVGESVSPLKLQQIFGRALRKDPDKKTKHIIHVRDPWGSDGRQPRGDETVKYMRHLEESGQIDPIKPATNPETGEVQLRATRIAQIKGKAGSFTYSAALNMVGEVVPHGNWEPRDVPVGFVSWRSILDRWPQTHQHTPLVILEKALIRFPHLLNPGIIIARKRTSLRVKPSWGMWLSPELAEAYHVVRRDMEAITTSGSYVTVPDIARCSGVDDVLVGRWIEMHRKAGDIPEISQAVVGLTLSNQSTGPRFGFPILMYPKSILQNEHLPTILERRPEDKVIWYSIGRLRKGECADISPDLVIRDKFLQFVEEYIKENPEKQEWVRERGVTGVGGVLDREFHVELIREYKRFIEDESHIIQTEYLVIHTLSEMGIPKSKVNEFVQSLPPDSSTKPYTRKWGGETYLRRDLVSKLIYWNLDSRIKLFKVSHFQAILEFLIKEDGTDKVDSSTLLAILDRHIREYIRKQSHSRRIDYGKVRALVDAVLGEYRSTNSTPLNHTPPHGN